MVEALPEVSAVSGVTGAAVADSVAESSRGAGL
jgi:hypothetical protein